jgi:2,6-dihydroxypyridine 3-monooxygenase
MVGFNNDGDGVVARFGNGVSAKGDLLVCADGLQSTARSILLPGVEPGYAGYVAWRGTTPEADLSEQARADLADSMIYPVLDPGHILVYAIPDHQGRTSPPHRVINWVWYRNYPRGGSFEDLMLDRDGAQRAGTMPPGMMRDDHLAELRATAGRVLAPTLREVVLGCERPMIQAVFDLESPQMAFDRVCLIGDAAFGLRPHVAAGQAKACADAWALRDTLESCEGDIDRALARWEQTQLALGRHALERTRQMGNASQFDGKMVPGDPAWKFGLWEPGN